MKKIERGTIKYLIVLFVLVSLCSMIVYPLFDLVYYRILTNSTFVYSFQRHIIQPIIFSCVYSITFWYFDKKRK